MKVEAAVSYAVKEGYRLADGAYCYDNKEEVGQALRGVFDSSVKCWKWKIDSGIKTSNSLGPVGQTDEFLLRISLIQDP